MAHITYDHDDTHTSIKPLDAAAWMALGLMLATIGVTAAILTMG